MILFIWNAFKPLTGNDYEPRLWRKVLESGKDQVRKVCATWTVRKNLSLFFFTVALFRANTTNSLHIFKDTFFLTKALKTVFPEGSFDMPRDIFLRYQTDSLRETGKPQGHFMWKFNLWNEPGCTQNTSHSPAWWDCVCGGVCLRPSHRREWVLILLFCFPNGFSQFIDPGAS